MKLINKGHRLSLVALLALALTLPFLGGCSEMGFSSDKDAAVAPPPDSTKTAPTTESQSYYPTDFNDLLIPAELTWNRENSMSIRTESFAGGILNFTGRVEVNSLTDFFINSMQKNGWKMAGSVKYKNVMLAFTKPFKTCMFSICEKGFTSNTDVYVYVTEDISARKNGAPVSENGLQ